MTSLLPLGKSCRFPHPPSSSSNPPDLSSPCLGSTCVPSRSGSATHTSCLPAGLGGLPIGILSALQLPCPAPKQSPRPQWRRQDWKRRLKKRRNKWMNGQRNKWMNVSPQTKCFCLHRVSRGTVPFLRLEMSFGDWVDTPNSHQMSLNA